MHITTCFQISGLIGALLLIDDGITFHDIKLFLQCRSNNCDYVKEIADTKSVHKYAFMYKCSKVKSLFYNELNDNNATQLKPQETFAPSVSIPIQYIIICCIILISLCILFVSIKHASKSKIHDAPLIQKIT